MEPRRVDRMFAEFWRYSLLIEIYESELELSQQYLQGTGRSETEAHSMIRSQQSLDEIVHQQAWEYFVSPQVYEDELLAREADLSPAQYREYHSILAPLIQVAQTRVEPVRLMTLAAQHRQYHEGMYDDALRSLLSPSEFMQREIESARLVEWRMARRHNFWEEFSGRRKSELNVEERLQRMLPFVKYVAIKEVERVWGENAADEMRARYEE